MHAGTMGEMSSIGYERPLLAYCVEKLRKFNGRKKILSGSAYRNRRYSTILRRLDI
jgi:hypothetical protein